MLIKWYTALLSGGKKHAQCDRSFEIDRYLIWKVNVKFGEIDKIMVPLHAPSLTLYAPIVMIHQILNSWLYIMCLWNNNIIEFRLARICASI